MRQIARQGAAAKVGVDIVGHGSKTGTQDANESLSLQRAAYIKQGLTTDSASHGNRAQASDVRFRETIIGSGTHDVVDPLDRRGEFKIVG